MEQVESFTSFGFVESIQKAIQAAGYTEPTPIQKGAIPHVLAGKDVLGLAQTGTGKTAAFALPILNRLLPEAKRTPRVLVIVPTRELATQVNDSFKTYAAGSKLKTCVIVGGMSYGPQFEQLRRGVDIVIACPGRLLDHMEKKSVDFRALEVLVLDEADQMFDMGFLPNIKRILKMLPVQRQNLLFSATMPPEIRTLAFQILKNPETVEVSKGTAATTVTHALYPVGNGQKGALLSALLTQMKSESVLIFTRTKHRAKKLSHDLIAGGFSATSLQGNLSQNARMRAMKGFRSGEFQILVATDIAARGIDISSISHVINFDIPDTVEAYVHRIGRTGRAAKTGDAFTFVAPEDNGMVRDIEARLKLTIERRKLEGFDYNQQGRGPGGGAERSDPRRERRFSPRQGQSNRGRRNDSRGPRSFGDRGDDRGPSRDGERRDDARGNSSEQRRPQGRWNNGNRNDRGPRSSMGNPHSRP